MLIFVKVTQVGNGVQTWFAYRLVNLSSFADFLIAVEVEMTKVSWPSRDRRCDRRTLARSGPRQLALSAQFRHGIVRARRPIDVHSLRK